MSPVLAVLFFLHAGDILTVQYTVVLKHYLYYIFIYRIFSQ